MSSSYSKKRFEIRNQDVISKGVPGVALWGGRLSHCDQVPKLALEMLNLVFEIIFILPTFRIASCSCSQECKNLGIQASIPW